MNGAPEPAGRFYKDARAMPVDGGFSVALDARALKTPLGAAFVVPTLALAKACAAEWRAQGEHILPATLRITQLAFAAIDWTARDPASRAAYVASYAETDLCCHRADSPEALVTRQSTLWDPLVAWGAEALDVRLQVVTGIVAAPSAPEAIAALRARAAAFDNFHLTALSQVTGLSGSALIGFALLMGRLDSKAAFEAAVLDDLWSLERWGEDAAARARLDRIKAEFDVLGAFIAALSAP
jgi:chaperone required for assembly of F1-ATPase